MRVSAKAEYACIAMVHLALHHRDPVPVRIKAIADAHGIPQRFLVQILLQLKTAGLVASVRGASGGYQLAKTPESITLAEVIAAIDDRSMTARSALGDDNKSPAAQALLAIWREIQVAENRLLDQLTLAELLRRSQSSNSLSYEI